MRAWYIKNTTVGLVQGFDYIITSPEPIAILSQTLPHTLRGVVQVDNRMRAWYIKNMSVGLLYQCSLGDLRLDSPVALLQNRRHEGLDFMEVVPMEHQLPAQKDQVITVLQVNCVL